MTPSFVFVSVFLKIIIFLFAFLLLDFLIDSFSCCPIPLYLLVMISHCFFVLIFQFFMRSLIRSSYEIYDYLSFSQRFIPTEIMGVLRDRC